MRNCFEPKDALDDDHSEILIVLAVVVRFASVAVAHDHWIDHGNYTDPVYNWRCCGSNDCKPVPPESIKPVKGGYQLPGGEIIPANRAIPSEDQYSYICWFGSIVQNTKVRCLFVVLPLN
jgi:hypothetical protein